MPQKEKKDSGESLAEVEKAHEALALVNFLVVKAVPSGLISLTAQLLSFFRYL